ncbi:MAG TPA: hypothetical protein VF773_04260 [Verrucomicrobiae bacterium]
MKIRFWPALFILRIATVFSTLVTISLAATAQGGGQKGVVQFTVYPWSESWEHLRVDKKLLRELSIPAVTVTRFETMEFSLTDEFIEIFKLTKSEVRQVTKAIADAQHAFRTVEGRSLAPVSVVPLRLMDAAKGDQRFQFRLARLPEEAGPIRTRLEEAVLSNLGEERTKVFWENARLLNGEIPPVTNGASFLHGGNASTYTFVLPAKHPGRVDLYYGSGRNFHGVTWGEPLDRYAPETLRPILAGWRKDAVKVESKSAADAVAKSSVRETGVESSNRAGNSKWDETVPFADLPKTVIKSLELPAFTFEEKFFPETVALFGLSEMEQQAVIDLYSEMKLRFEQLERANFHRVKPGRNNFVIKAFPEESAALKAEWVEKLKELVGATRGELLDKSIRTELSPDHAMNKPEKRDGILRNFDGHWRRGPNWFRRGTEETQIDVTTGEENGRPMLKIDHKTGGEGGERGSGSVPGGRIPVRWQHLLTPDMLGLPVVL